MNVITDAIPKFNAGLANYLYLLKQQCVESNYALSVIFHVSCDIKSALVCIKAPAFMQTNADLKSHETRRMGFSISRDVYYICIQIPGISSQN